MAPDACRAPPRTTSAVSGALHVVAGSAAHAVAVSAPGPPPPAHAAPRKVSARVGSRRASSRAARHRNNAHAPRHVLRGPSPCSCPPARPAEYLGDLGKTRRPRSRLSRRSIGSYCAGAAPAGRWTRGGGYSPPTLPPHRPQRPPRAQGARHLRPRRPAARPTGSTASARAALAPDPAPAAPSLRLPCSPLHRQGRRWSISGCN